MIDEDGGELADLSDLLFNFGANFWKVSTSAGVHQKAEQSIATALTFSFKQTKAGVGKGLCFLIVDTNPPR